MQGYPADATPVNTATPQFYPAAPITRRSGVRLAAGWQQPAAIWTRPAGKGQPHTRVENTFWSEGIARQLGPIPSGVYFYLRSLADANAQCWPSPRRIALEIGASQSSVKRALRTLASLGLIDVGECFQEGTHENATNLYTLLPLSSFRAPSHPGPTLGHTEPTKTAEVCSHRTPNKNQPFSEQKPNNNARRTQKAPPEPPPPPEASVVAASLRPDNHTHPSQCEQLDAALLAQVLAVGVKPAVARALLAGHTPEQIAAQLEMLDAREPRNPAAVLVQAIRQDWSPPAKYLQRQAAQEAKISASEARDAQSKARDAEAQQKAAEAAQRAQAEDESARLDAEWQAMPEIERAPIERALAAHFAAMPSFLRRADALAAQRRNLQRGLNLPMPSAGRGGPLFQSIST